MFAWRPSMPLERFVEDGDNPLLLGERWSGNRMRDSISGPLGVELRLAREILT